MKKAASSGSSGLQDLIAILAIYLLIIILMLLFVRQFLSDIAAPSAMTNRLLIPTAIVLPLFLLGSLIFRFRRLLRDKQRRKPGAHFKTNLIKGYIIIVLLASIPQGFLSFRFIQSAMDYWFSPVMERALEDGLEITLDYYNRTLTSLTRFNDSQVYASLMYDFAATPRQIWDSISDANAAISSLQVFNPEGREIMFFGDAESKLPAPPPPDSRTGLLPTTDQREVLRSLRYFTEKGETYTAILSAKLPEGFDSNAVELTRARAITTQYNMLQRRFFIALFLFYAVFSLPMILTAILISIILGDVITKPLVNLEEATRRVTQGDYSYRLLTRSGDELAALSLSFNHMIAELDRSRRQLIQTEKVSAWQEIARRLAHEIKNPLTPIKLSAERLKRKYQRDPAGIGPVLESSAEVIIHEVDNLSRLLKQFRDFSQNPDPIREPIDLAQILRDTTRTYQVTYSAVTFKTEDIPEKIVVNADAEQIKRVFQNLIKNALEALEDRRGEISLRINLVRKGNVRYCRVQIEDNGAGIPAELQEEIFNPYYTTKKEGSGLGLPILERILFAHGGRIWFESEPGVGTTFFIDLPMEI